MRLSTDLESKRFADKALERRDMTRRRPDFQFRVADRSNLQQAIVAAIVKIDGLDGLLVTAIQAFGEPQNCGKRADGLSPFPAKIAESIVALLRRGLPMVTGHERDGLDLFRLESSKIAVLDQIVRMFVMVFVADVHSDVVQNRRIFQPLALAISQPVDRTRLIEERNRQTRDLVRVLGPVVAALGELEDASASYVGIAIRTDDLFPVARDVVEDETFAQ